MIMDGKELFALLSAVARAKGLPDIATVLEAREYLHKTFPKPRYRAAFILTCFKECSEVITFGRIAVLIVYSVKETVLRAQSVPLADF